MGVKPGSILRGKYRLDAAIGRGGMGQVFSATDLEAQDEVAIKVVSRIFLDDVLMARLQREAQAATRIRSDYVPRVIEVSETDDGETFLVMERLIGEPLSAHLRERGPMAWRDVARVGEDILRGLIDAHTAGIVHRDLKPSNVFLAVKNSRMRAMILDFGICKMDTVDKERLTGTGESIGTVAYMAPEQIRGAAKVDDRADLYAFGVMVFEMLTGRLPHEGPSQMAILASKLEKPHAPLLEHTQVAIPEGLDVLVARTLCREPRDRFASAQDLLKAWRALSPETTIEGPVSTRIRGVDQDAPTISAPGNMDAAVEPHPTQTALTAGTSIRKSAGSAKLAIGLAAAGLVFGIVVVGVVATRAPSTEATPASSSVVEPEGMASNAVLAIPIELGDDAGVSSDAPPPPGRPRTFKKPFVVRPSPHAPAPAPSGPHITTKPRY